MRNIFFILPMISLIFITPNMTEAHSGGTDASGGHHCWTDCESHGLEYGEYHYHDGGTINTAQNDYDEGYSRGYELAYSYTNNCEEEYEWWWEGPEAFGQGYEDGIEQGHADGMEVCKRESIEKGKKDGYYNGSNNYTYGMNNNVENYSSEEYEWGYRNSFNEGRSDYNDKRIKEGKGKEEEAAVLTTSTTANDTTETDSNNDKEQTSYYWVFIIIIVVGAAVILGYLDSDRKTK
ncbi:YHYH domain-containing protein (plasmid) [Rossellomorea sp. AcN35-11]|nr:YHYH domain-containing protein [Rossellomorea aquimaris]WJV31902.1 YHYH domain-containing protein [Rossellomorea sp. AcN35-11]